MGKTCNFSKSNATKTSFILALLILPRLYRGPLALPMTVYVVRQDGVSGELQEYNFLFLYVFGAPFRFNSSSSLDGLQPR